MKFFLSPKSLYRTAPKSPSSVLHFGAFQLAEADEIDDEMEILTLLVISDESADHDWKDTFSGCKLDDGRVIVAVSASWGHLAVHGKRVSIGKTSVVEPDFVILLQDPPDHRVLAGLQAAGIPSVLNSFDSSQPTWANLLDQGLPLLPQTYHSSIRDIQDLRLPTRLIAAGGHVMDVMDEQSWSNIQVVLRIMGDGRDVSAVIQPVIQSESELVVQKVGGTHRSFRLNDGELIEEVPTSKMHARWIEIAAGDRDVCHLRITNESATGLKYITHISGSHASQFRGHLSEDSSLIRDLAMARMNEGYTEAFSDTFEETDGWQ